MNLRLSKEIGVVYEQVEKLVSKDQALDFDDFSTKIQQLLGEFKEQCYGSLKSLKTQSPMAIIIVKVLERERMIYSGSA